MGQSVEGFLDSAQKKWINDTVDWSWETVDGTEQRLYRDTHADATGAYNLVTALMGEPPKGDFDIREDKLLWNVLNKAYTLDVGGASVTELAAILSPTDWLAAVSKATDADIRELAERVAANVHGR